MPSTPCSCLREGLTAVASDPFCKAPSHLWDAVNEIEVTAL